MCLWIGIYIRLSVNISRITPDLTTLTQRVLMRIILSALHKTQLISFSRFLHAWRDFPNSVFAFPMKRKYFRAKSKFHYFEKWKKTISMLPFSASLLCLFFLLFCFNFKLRKQLPFSAVPSRCPPKKQQTTVKFMYEL